MIRPEEISVGNVLDYLTSEGDWVPAVMDWQDIKWLSEDPEGFNAVHRPRDITEAEANFNNIYSLPVTLTIGLFTVQVNRVHRLQNFHFQLTNTVEKWKTLPQESTT